MTQKLTPTQVASLAGRAAHVGGNKADGTPRKLGHQFQKDSNKTREAGAKGGRTSQRRLRLARLFLPEYESQVATSAVKESDVA